MRDVRSGPGRRRGCPRRLPQIRTCPIKAYGPSSRGFASATLSVGIRLTRDRVPMHSPCFCQRCHDSAPPSLHGVRAAPVPPLQRYYETLRRPTVRPATLGCLRVHGTTPRACLRVSRKPDAGLGPGVFGFGHSQPNHRRDGNDRDSQVPGEPSCPYALLFDPGRSARTRPMQCSGTAPAVSTAKAPTKVLSGLNHTASGLAVYASQPSLPKHHARLASGCWPSSPGRDWLPAEFLRKVSEGTRYTSSSLPKLLGARTPYLITARHAVFADELGMVSPEFRIIRYGVPRIPSGEKSRSFRKFAVALIGTWTQVNP